MKLGILKPGANITWKKNVFTAANIDIHTLCRVLHPDCEIHIISGQTRNTKIPAVGNFHNILTCDINGLGLDALLTFNGNVNFFGGAESPEGIMNYVHINQFEGPVFIINTDGQLAFKQLWPAIEPKPWSSNWRVEDIWVNRRDIQYITQGRDPKKTKKEYEKQKGFIKPAAYHSFPIEQAILAQPPKVTLREPKYDLIYGGRPRSTQRQKDITEFYGKHTEGLTVHFFGGFTRKALRVKEPHQGISFGSKVSNASFIPKMSEGFFTCIVGDPFYHDNFFTLRMYESILAGCLPFISMKMDSQKEFYSDPLLKDMMYVSSGKELADKIRNMDSGDVAQLYEAIYVDKVESFDREQYSQNLISLIRKGLQLRSDVI